MNESLIQQYYKKENNTRRPHGCKLHSLRRIMTLLNELQSRLILVPAAAVIREGQALFVVTRRKGSVDCKISFKLKTKVSS